MKVKDFEVEGNSAKEVLEGITEEHTNAKVSRISEGLYNVHLELKEEQPASYVPKGWSICRRAGRICMHENCIGRIACVYKRGSLVYKLYQADSNIRILTDDREKLVDTLAELVCLGVQDVVITGDTKLASDTCVVFSSDNLRITPIMKGE